MSWQYYSPTFEYETYSVNIDEQSAWIGHKYFAYDLIRNIKPKVVVELGTHFGTSFFSMCQAVKDLKLDTKLYAVDSWQGDKHTGFYDDSIHQIVKNIKQKYYKKQRVFLLKSSFDAAHANFKDSSIDLLHIDGLHTYEAVKHDFNNWFNKVKTKGIILFHDTSEKKMDFGVYRLLDELKTQFKTLEFFHSHGLGILFKDLKSYNKVSEFKTIWQHYYPSISENKVLKVQIAQQNEKERRLTNENKNLKNQIQSLESALNIIKSSRTFKLWQAYCKFRDRIF